RFPVWPLSRDSVAAPMARRRGLFLQTDICLMAPLTRESEKRYLIRNTSIVSVCRSVGVLTGLILDAVILASFGLGIETDAFFAALAIPFMIDGSRSTQFTQVSATLLSSIETGSGSVTA